MLVLRPEPDVRDVLRTAPPEIREIVERFALSDARSATYKGYLARLAATDEPISDRAAQVLREFEGKTNRDQLLRVLDD